MFINYLGYSIRFNESAENWSIEGNAGYKSYNTLKAAKAHIDALEKEARRINIECFYIDYSRSKPVSCTAVLLDDDCAWITTKDGRRRKERISSLVVDTPEARKAFDAVADMRKQIEGLENSISEAIQALPSLVVQPPVIKIPGDAEVM